MGGVAEAYYGIPEEIKVQAMAYLDDNFKQVLKKAYEKISEKK